MTDKKNLSYWLKIANWAPPNAIKRKPFYTWHNAIDYYENRFIKLIEEDGYEEEIKDIENKLLIFYSYINNDLVDFPLEITAMQGIIDSLTIDYFYWFLFDLDKNKTINNSGNILKKFYIKWTNIDPEKIFIENEAIFVIALNIRTGDEEKLIFNFPNWVGEVKDLIHQGSLIDNHYITAGHLSNLLFDKYFKEILDI